MKVISVSRGLSCMVDDEDYDLLSSFKWYAVPSRETFYASRRSASKCLNGRDGSRVYAEGIACVGMHRQILKISDKKIQVDHIDGNGLNNQKSNLRICNHRENQGNSLKHRDGCSSKFKGVTWNKHAKKWRAIFGSPKRHCLGYCENEKEAALLYNVAASFYFKEFAKLNEVNL